MRKSHKQLEKTVFVIDRMIEQYYYKYTNKNDVYSVEHTLVWAYVVGRCEYNGVPYNPEVLIRPLAVVMRTCF